MPVKNLKLSFITVCLCFIFLLIIGAADLYAYHDQGPSHLEGNCVACILANHHKSKYPPLLHEPRHSLNLPEFPVHIPSPSERAAPHPTSPFLSDFPSRASPA